MRDHHHGHHHHGARRGELKYVLLDVLKAGPLHGYELIQAFDKRSGGRYVPSPGSIYPTLHKLEEFGLVSSEQKMDRRVFRLTAAGQVLLASSVAEVEEFWQRWETPSLPDEIEVEYRAIGTEWQILDELINRRLLMGIGGLDLVEVQHIRQTLAACRLAIQERLEPRGAP